MATKRISRQAIPEDPVAASYQRAQDFVLRSWRPILVATLVIVAVVAVSLIVRNSRRESERVARGFWVRAQGELVVGNYANALSLATSIEEEHGGTRSADRATLIRADALAGMGDLEGALVAYDEAIPKVTGDDLLLTSARRGKAVTLEDLGRPAEAAALYRELGDGAMPAGGRIFDLRAAARCYLAVGDRASAIGALEDLVARYSDQTEDSRAVRDQVRAAEILLAELQYQPS